jgi:hypothetical protein
MPTQASELIFFFSIVFLLTLSLSGFILMLLLKDQQKQLNFQNNINKIRTRTNNFKISNRSSRTFTKKY